MCTLSGSVERIERCIGTGLFTQLTVLLFSLLTKVLLLPGLSTQIGQRRKIKLES